MKIYKVGLSIGRIAQNKFLIECDEYTETAKTFKKYGTVLNKDKIMALDSIYNNRNPGHQGWHTYCFENQISEAKKIIHDKIAESLASIEQDLLKAKALLSDVAF